jgi:hypothetical protein
LRTLGETAKLDLGEGISSMELAHGGGTLSVTAGSKVHFLDILRLVSHLVLHGCLSLSSLALRSFLHVLPAQSLSLRPLLSSSSVFRHLRTSLIRLF